MQRIHGKKLEIVDHIAFIGRKKRKLKPNVLALFLPFIPSRSQFTFRVVVFYLNQTILVGLSSQDPVLIS